MMSPPAPAITIRSGGWQRTFAAGHDVVVGRDIHADVRIPHPSISRSHVILRYLDGRWVAFDDNSFNGMFVADQRVQSVEIDDQRTILLGGPDGPPLTFELGTAPPADESPTQSRDYITIGRSADNDIVVPDMLASLHHAKLVTTGVAVQLQNTDGGGTFVNGENVTAATLGEHDVVTIGNVDFVYTDGSLVRRTQPAAATGGLEVRDVSLAVGRDTLLLERISLDARPGTLTAVIGPSGSGKSTLSRVIVGAARPTGGAVSFDGRDLHDGYGSLRSRIGMVPQDDVVHGRLTVAQALGFAAELRMPADTTEADRRRVIDQILEELELSAHAASRIDKLSGGQRKRVSVALELLTGPSLLVLDEPTTGLDPALDRAVMTMLRRLADAGRVVVVVTHSLTFLEDCDQVLLLAPGGKTAFCGPPAELASAMGTTDWADIFTMVSADPDDAQRRSIERSGPTGEHREEAPPATSDTVSQLEAGNAVQAPQPAPTSAWRQCATIARRQVRLLIADRGYLAFLAVLPFVIGLLPLTVVGHAGFGHPPSDGSAPFEPKHVIALISFAAILMGATLTVRDLVGERAIFRREQSAGLSASAYLLAKIAVFGAVAVIQSALLVLVVTAPGFGKPGPSGAAALGVPALELFIDVAATCVAAAVLGLALSSLARTNDQVIVLLAVALVTQLVFAGGFIPVTGRPLLETIAWIMPGRWGFAATASTADLSNLVVGIAQDSHWQHSAAAWLFDMVVLGVLTALCAGVARWRLRLPTG
ncbi:ATP-binding cassette domain-containing protein [Mycolicibacterium gadium]|uniref:ATP-binding cassette domain-containing protein n=1 Tax=Mycolicibacterium gadium TaxID=1794 RepID=A0ABT6GVW0_MYCGU|nr:ATP-binding cassette domain-containing protein [Mycolicibacterium gadium]MDG5485383.1 ATP-binding cassette domain-containing protein [Mycolicibacterium gadium]